MPIPPRTPYANEAAIAADVARIQCPFQRARHLTAIAHDHGTLPPPLARLRDAALLEGRPLVDTVKALAEQVGMKRSRVSHLVTRAALANASTPRPGPATSTAPKEN